MTVKIIAEIGVNHNGSVDLAKKLIFKAKSCGADMVKFQTFSADRLAARATPKVPYQLRTSDPDESHYAMLKQLELSAQDHIDLKAYCEQVGFQFCSTPYSREDAAFLYDLGVDYFKVASADIVDRTLHEFLAQTGRMCILATGMATIQEIEDTIDIYNRYDASHNVILLQCTSAYPASPSDANLLVMQTLRKRFGCRVGYSDHTPGCDCAVIAAALNASIIEKHFTLDKTLPGPDHSASATPDEFARMVEAVRGVERILGNGVKFVNQSEESMRVVARKSIVVKLDLPAGHVISLDDLAFQRPGTGISPMEYPKLVGRTLRCDLSKGEQLKHQDTDLSKAP